MTHRPKCVSTPKHEAPKSIFSQCFLERLEERSVDGHCEHEAGFTGPWRVEAIGDGYAVVRDGDEKPRGVFKHRETACLVAAVLPAVGSDSLYAVNRSAELVRVIGQDQPATIGKMRAGDQDVASAVHIAAWFLRSPHSLALLLEAAGYDVLATAGRLVANRKAAARAS